MTQPASNPAGLPAVVDALAAQLVALYADAEQQLMAEIAAAARAGVVAPAYSASRLAMQSLMLRAAQRVATSLRLRSYPLAMNVTAHASQLGEQSAAAMLRRLVQADPLLRKSMLTEIPNGHAIGSANHIGMQLATGLDGTFGHILRFGDDAYRAAVAEASIRQVLSIETPATAQSLAWKQLTERGITGLTDTAGRDWNLSTYVEMATRTAVQRSFNSSHLDRMTAVGVEQFTVTDDGHPCPLCQPWQGVVLTLDGPGATIDEATAAGLFHPNCRHTLVAHFPGVTTVKPPKPWTAADQTRYDDTQRLRALERRVRAAKREAAASLTPLERKRAEAKVRALQARIRQHVAASGLNRRPHREQLDLGNH